MSHLARFPVFYSIAEEGGKILLFLAPNPLDRITAWAAFEIAGVRGSMFTDFTLMFIVH